MVKHNLHNLCTLESLIWKNCCRILAIRWTHCFAKQLLGQKNHLPQPQAHKTLIYIELENFRSIVTFGMPE